MATKQEIKEKAEKLESAINRHVDSKLKRLAKERAFLLKVRTSSGLNNALRSSRNVDAVIGIATLNLL